MIPWNNKKVIFRIVTPNFKEKKQNKTITAKHRVQVSYPDFHVQQNILRLLISWEREREIYFARINFNWKDASQKNCQCRWPGECSSSSPLSFHCVNRLNHSTYLPTGITGVHTISLGVLEEYILHCQRAFSWEWISGYWCVGPLNLIIQNIVIVTDVSCLTLLILLPWICNIRMCSRRPRLSKVRLSWKKTGTIKFSARFGPL